MKLRKIKYGESHVLIADTHILIADLHKRCVDYVKALENYQGALTIIKKNFGEIHIKVI